ncbi:MAG: pyridoxal phosphate-dependent aminotransferase, partial [Acidimicrobiales bacterium]
PDLREAIAVKTKRDSGIDVDAADVLVTNGGKHAVYNTLLALLDEGDEAIIPAPFWTTYPEPVALAGGVPVYVDTDESTGFKATVDQLEAVRTDRTKLIIFVSPSNPTGAVYSKEQVEAVGRWALEHEIFVVTDEIYEHLTFGDNEFHSILRLVPELADRCVILNGVAKTFAMTGWRVGWMIGPRDVIKAATNLQSHSTSNVCNVAQRAAIAAVSGPLDAVVDMRTAFERRSKVAHSMLNAIDGVTCIEPEGAFYAFPNLTGLLGRPIRGRKAETTVELAEILLEEAKVAVVPGEAFGAPGYARLSFALGDDDLAEGLRRIAELVSS